MALIDLNLNPSHRDLRWFGVLGLLFFLLAGGFVAYFTAMTVLAVVLVAIGTAFCLTYYAVRPLRLVMYRGWLRLFQPVGWLISHALFAMIYFVVFTSIGLILRLAGHDPMQRRRNASSSTYWRAHEPPPDASRYFRQF